MEFRLQESVSDFLPRHGTIIYPIAAFYTAPGTWHPHIYNKPPKRPTPFLISNILDDIKDGKDRLNVKCENQTRSETSVHYFGQRVCSPDRPKFGDQKSSGSSNGHSPCNFMRDRVESPINAGNLHFSAGRIASIYGNISKIYLFIYLFISQLCIINVAIYMCIIFFDAAACQHLFAVYIICWFFFFFLLFFS